MSFRTVAAWVTTVLAGGLVLAALLAPDRPGDLTPAVFARIPVEALAGVALVLVLTARARPVVAVLLGAVLGILTVLRIVGMGFYQILDKPFDPVLDWTLLGNAVEFLGRSIGGAGATAAAVGAVVAAVAVVALMALAVRRLSRLVAEHRTGAVRAVTAFGVIWLACALLGVQIAPGAPLAARGAATFALGHTTNLYGGLRDRHAFAEQVTADPYRDVPGDALLTALRGKDVIIAFVESYGCVALDDPGFSAMLDTGDRRLRAAGFGARSGRLTSPTAGGGSWMAHATLLSGMWVDNQQRYRILLGGDRLTLGGAFRRAGWRTVGVIPGANRAWPEGKAFYEYDQLYTAENMGYQGPLFAFASMPDQYTLAAFHRAERAAPDHVPVAAEIVLLSSHGPWVPLPRPVDWDAVGDGTVFAGMQEGFPAPDELVRDPARVRAAYLRSVEYSMDALISYVERYGGDDLALVLLGDHQPSPIITGERASRQVPITIVARDRAVLDRAAAWGWQDGLKPGPEVPVWRMDTFRDRFLAAYGP